MDSLLACTRPPNSPVDPDEILFGHLVTLAVALSLLVVAHLAMLLLTTP